MAIGTIAAVARQESPPYIELDDTEVVPPGQTGGSHGAAGAGWVVVPGFSRLVAGQLPAGCRRLQRVAEDRGSKKQKNRCAADEGRGGGQTMRPQMNPPSPSPRRAGTDEGEGAGACRRREVSEAFRSLTFSSGRARSATGVPETNEIAFLSVG